MQSMYNLVVINALLATDKLFGMWAYTVSLHLLGIGVLCCPFLLLPVVLADVNPFTSN